jgi:hypothetical protein
MCVETVCCCYVYDNVLGVERVCAKLFAKSCCVCVLLLLLL